MLRRVLQRLARVKYAPVQQQRQNSSHAFTKGTSTTLLLSGSILGWLNLQKDESLYNKSETVTKIDPDSKLVETIHIAAKSINVSSTYSTVITYHLFATHPIEFKINSTFRERKMFLRSSPVRKLSGVNRPALHFILALKKADFFKRL